MSDCTYKLRVIDITVHKWGGDSEGEGDHVCNKGGFTIGSFDTIAKAKAELADFFGYEPDYEAYKGEDYVCGGIIENEDAYADPNGEYIADYVVVLDKVCAVSNWGASA